MRALLLNPSQFLPRPVKLRVARPCNLSTEAENVACYVKSLKFINNSWTVGDNGDNKQNTLKS